MENFVKVKEVKRLDAYYLHTEAFIYTEVV